MIKIEYLKKSFNDNIVLHDVNLQIKKGECVCVIGPIWFRKIDITPLYQSLGIPGGR